jgi:hypothetical protein
MSLLRRITDILARSETLANADGVVDDNRAGGRVALAGECRWLLYEHLNGWSARSSLREERHSPRG